MADVGPVEKGPSGWSLRGVLNKKKTGSLRTTLDSLVDPSTFFMLMQAKPGKRGGGNSAVSCLENLLLELVTILA